MKIGLVTDSTSDIPLDLVHKFSIEVVPAILNIDDASYLDGEGMTREDFYERLPGFKSSPTTAAPSVGSFQERYEKLLSAGAEKILSIHPPEKLSGIFNAARLAAETFGNKVHVLDSGQLSLGLGFQVLAAADAIANNTILVEILDIIDSIQKRVRVLALLDTMEYLRRSGRVSWAKAMVGGLLNIKPVIELRFGVIKRIGQARTRADGVKQLLENFQNWEHIERLAILHTNAEAAARRLLEDLNTKLKEPPLIVNITTVVGTHVGPNGLGIVAIPSV